HAVDRDRSCAITVHGSSRAAWIEVGIGKRTSRRPYCRFCTEADGELKSAILAVRVFGRWCLVGLPHLACALGCGLRGTFSSVASMNGIWYYAKWSRQDAGKNDYAPAARSDPRISQCGARERARDHGTSLASKEHEKERPWPLVRTNSAARPAGTRRRISSTVGRIASTSPSCRSIRSPGSATRTLGYDCASTRNSDSACPAICVVRRSSTWDAATH